MAFLKLAFFKRINDKTNLVLVLILDLLFAMLLFSSVFFCNAVSKMNHLSVFTASTKMHSIYLIRIWMENSQPKKNLFVWCKRILYVNIHFVCIRQNFNLFLLLLSLWLCKMAKNGGIYDMPLIPTFHPTELNVWHRITM